MCRKHDFSMSDDKPVPSPKLMGEGENLEVG
jgi:hypothetical protein